LSDFQRADGEEHSSHRLNEVDAMFRYVPLMLVGTLCALAAFAAGISEDIPMGAQIVFVATLAIFFGALLAGLAGERSEQAHVAEQSTH
jgi:formate hydrogenlyase subunit 4